MVHASNGLRVNITILRLFKQWPVRPNRKKGSHQFRSKPSRTQRRTVAAIALSVRVNSRPPERISVGGARETIGFVSVKALFLALLMSASLGQTAPSTLNTNLQFRLLLNTTSVVHSVRIAKPRH